MDETGKARIRRSGPKTADRIGVKGFALKQRFGG
jgi:hypothetical protein